MNELTYVFGAPLGSTGTIAPPYNYTMAEVSLSKAVIMYWSNFVKTGLVSMYFLTCYIVSIYSINQ